MSSRALLFFALVFTALAMPACKSQNPAVVLTLDGSYRIPVDVDTLRVDIYDVTTMKVIESQTFDLQAGTNFPFTVLVVDSGTPYQELNIIATATHTGNGGPVGEGQVQVQLKDGATVDATINLADQ